MRRILIAHDDGAERDSLSANLTEAGYAVELANDGQDALDKARSYLPDLILLDAMLPELSSFDVCRALKDDSQLCRIKVIVITPLSGVGAIQKGIEAGTDDFLAKPIVKAELLDRTQSILRLSDVSSE